MLISGHGGPINDLESREWGVITGGVNGLGSPYWGPRRVSIGELEDMKFL